MHTTGCLQLQIADRVEAHAEELARLESRNCGKPFTAALKDEIPAIADVCEREGIWLHVDAAYGGAAAIVPGMEWVLAGADRADPLARYVVDDEFGDLARAIDGFRRQAADLVRQARSHAHLGAHFRPTATPTRLRPIRTIGQSGCVTARAEMSTIVVSRSKCTTNRPQS